MNDELLIDVDIHHTWSSDTALLPYLDPDWRPFFERVPDSAPYGKYGRLHPPHIKFPNINGVAMRPETVPSVGGPPCSHYETFIEQHIERHQIDRAILTWGYGLHPGYLNASASVALCRAANDYMVDYWLGPADERVYGTLGVPVAVPDEAAREIRRLGRHPHVAAVLVVANPFSKPFGHPVYHPIYEAAADMNLPIITHVGSDSTNKGSWAAAGLPTTKIEYFAVLEQSGMHHFSSLLSEGVFEKFPTLRVLFNEDGFTWVPWLLWSLDSRYEMLKRENPKLRRLPSEYFLNHIWMGTQPMAGETPPAKVNELLQTFPGLEDRLCYASDYPHWDSENPQHIVPRLPAAWRAKIMGENACRLFGWSPDELKAKRRIRQATNAKADAYA